MYSAFDYSHILKRAEDNMHVVPYQNLTALQSPSTALLMCVCSACCVLLFQMFFASSQAFGGCLMKSKTIDTEVSEIKSLGCESVKKRGGGGKGRLG